MNLIASLTLLHLKKIGHRCSQIISLREIWISKTLKIVFTSSAILFAVLDRHQNLGVRFVEALYLALQNNDPDGERHHPLFEYVDSLLVEYALATGRSIPDRPDNHPISDWLHYRTISALQRSVRDSGEEELASILNVGFDVPDWAKQRIQQLPWYGEERESESLSITTLQEWAWRCVSDGFEKSTNIVSEHGTLVPVLSPYWMFLYPNSFDVNDFPASARENFEALCDGLSAHWHTGFATTESFGSPSGQYVEAFFPTLMPFQSFYNSSRKTSTGV